MPTPSWNPTVSELNPATTPLLPSGNYDPRVFTPGELVSIAGNDKVKNVGLKTILGTLVASALATGGLRGLIGHRYLFGRPGPRDVYKPPQSTIGVPVPDKASEEETKKTKKLFKRAFDLSGLLGLNRLVRNDAGVVTEVRPPSDSIFTPDAASKVTNLPFFYPGMVAAGLVGGYGGYKLVDSWLDAKRKAELAEEVNDAKKQYKKVLLSQYNSPGTKTASASQADRTAAAIDSLYDKLCLLKKQAMEKKATWWNPLDWFGVPAESQTGLWGVPLAIATALGLYSGWSSYNAARARSSSKLIEEAFKKRERARWSARPTEFRAAPVRVSAVDKKKKAADDEEEADSAPSAGPSDSSRASSAVDWER